MAKSMGKGPGASRTCVGISGAGCCLSPAHGAALSPSAQYIDAISSKQGELETSVSEGYQTALTEERRRFCFLVEKQCAVAKSSAAYHSKVSAAEARASGLEL